MIMSNNFKIPFKTLDMNLVLHYSKKMRPKAEIQKKLLQISAFFLFSNIRKGRLLYIHPVGRLVGRLVGRSVDVTIDFFSIYRGIKALY